MIGMANTYRGVSEYGVAVYGEEPVELELSVVEERDLVANGHVEIVPRDYEVTSGKYEHPAGETFSAAMLQEPEAMLIAQGHIKRVEEKPKPARKATAKKAAARKRSN